jgi:hypothetical protein
MGNQYVLRPDDQPPWWFEPGEFAIRLRRRWPHARTVDLSESPIRLHALIVADPVSRELGVVLAEGCVVVLNPATPAGAVEFTLWYIGQLPAFDPAVQLIVNNNRADATALRPDTTAEELLTKLASTDVERPSPSAVGQRAAEILHAIHHSPHHHHHQLLATAIRMLPNRWATLTGITLLADLDLATDAEPLLHEAWRLLALRAAVYELTGSDTTAATLVAPAPIDDMVRAILAEHTLCADLARTLGVRLVQQTTEWTPLGWQPGNYAHRCYQVAWGQPPDRYWIDADESSRRLATLTRLYHDIGIRRSGSQHTCTSRTFPTRR